MAIGRKNVLSLAMVCIAWFTVIAFHIFRFPPNPISWDTFGYYLYLPFTYIYHDLGLHHKEILDHVFALYDPSSSFYQASRIHGGNWIMKYTMGMAILYSPGFFVANLLAAPLGYPADGFSFPYQVALVINSMLIFIIGYWYLRKVLLQFFSDRLTALVLLVLFFGTNLYAFSVFLLETPHNYLFAFYAMILWNTIRWHQNYRTKNMIALGLLIGLATLARPTELLTILIPLFWNTAGFKDVKEKLKLLFVTYRQQTLLFILILLVIGSFQVIYWKLYSGNLIYYSYVNPGEGFEFLSPYTLKVLFSFRKGWFIYTPLMLFAVAGFWFVYKENRKIFYALFIFFLLNLYIISSWSCWWYAQSMGHRAFIQSYPVMAITLGFFLRWTGRKKLVLKIFVTLFVLFFVWLNLFQTWQLHYHIISGDRMTFEYYFKSFGKIRRDPKLDKYLLVQRLYRDNKPFISDESEYTRKVLRKFDYEDADGKTNSHLTHKYAHSGSYALKMDSTMKYSSSFRAPFDELTKHYYAWLKISVWVYPVHPVRETPWAIVATFQHNKKYYNYRTLGFNDPDVSKKLKLNQWNKVEMLYLTPEVRSKKDGILIHLWNRGKKDVYFDDFKIEILEPKSIE